MKNIFKMFVLATILNTTNLNAQDLCQDDPSIRCSVGHNYTQVEFFPTSFQSRNFGIREGEHWKIPAKANDYQGCFATTRNEFTPVGGRGAVDISVRFHGAMSTIIRDISDIRSIPLFVLRLSYTEPSGRTKNVDSIVDITALGELIEVGSDPDLGGFYVASLTSDIDIRIEQPINIPNGAKNITVSGCNVSKDTMLKIASFTLTKIDL